jgi:hypothetical protein
LIYPSLSYLDNITQKRSHKKGCFCCGTTTSQNTSISTILHEDWTLDENSEVCPICRGLLELDKVAPSSGSCLLFEKIDQSAVSQFFYTSFGALKCAEDEKTQLAIKKEIKTFIGAGKKNLVNFFEETDSLLKKDKASIFMPSKMAKIVSFFDDEKHQELGEILKDIGFISFFPNPKYYEKLIKECHCD